MQAPPGDIPRQLDRYRVAGALDTHLGADGGVRHLLARDDTTGRHEILMAVLAGPAADDAGYRLRFRSEAGKSRRLGGRWAAPVTAVAPPESPLPWVAYDCGPALPLPAALAAQGGPLPEEAVRALGTALAETLLDAHRNGLVYAGISPETVLLTPAGPALTGFGLVRAASPEGTVRHSVPGVAPESLPPEQRAGDGPQPLGDVYALGSVLAYAATGVRAPAAHRLPEGLRPVLAACLAPDPAARPQADALLVQLAPQGAPPVGAMAPSDAVLRALEAQGAQHRSAQPPPPYVPAQPQHPAPQAPQARPVPPAPSPQGSTETRPVPPKRSPGRRALLAGAGYGALGLGVGASAVAGWRATRPAPGPPSDPLAVAGAPPAPLWRYGAEDGSIFSGLIPTGRRRGVVTTDDSQIGLDLATGKRLWSRDDMYLDGPPVHLGGGQLLMREDESFSVVSARSGQVKWREEKYSDPRGDSLEAVLAVQDGTVYFLAKRWTDLGDDEFDVKVIAYRIRGRKQLWSRTIPEAFGPGTGLDSGSAAPLMDGGALVLPNTGVDNARTHQACLALGLRDGRKLWEREYRDLTKSGYALDSLVPGGLLLSGQKKGRVQARSLRTGRLRWSSKVEGAANTVHGLRDGTVYVLDAKETVHALDLRDGSSKWRRRWPGAPVMVSTDSTITLSASGKVLLLSTEEGVIALDARSGKLLWRFAGVAAEGVGPPSSDESFGESAGRVLAQVPGMVLVVTMHALYALPVD